MMIMITIKMYIEHISSPRLPTAHHKSLVVISTLEAMSLKLRLKFPVSVTCSYCQRQSVL